MNKLLEEYGNIRQQLSMHEFAYLKEKERLQIMCRNCNEIKKKNIESEQS